MCKRQVKTTVFFSYSDDKRRTLIGMLQMNEREINGKWKRKKIQKRRLNIDSLTQIMDANGNFKSQPNEKF